MPGSRKIVWKASPINWRFQQNSISRLTNEENRSCEKAPTKCKSQRFHIFVLMFTPGAPDDFMSSYVLCWEIRFSSSDYRTVCSFVVNTSGKNKDQKPVTEACDQRRTVAHLLQSAGHAAFFVQTEAEPLQASTFPWSKGQSWTVSIQVPEVFYDIW